VKKKYSPFQRFWTTDAGLTGVLVFLILFLITGYLLDRYYVAKVLSLIFISLFFLSGVLSVYQRPLGRLLFVGLALGSLGFIWIDFFFPEFGLRTARTLAAAVTVVYLIFLLLRQVFSEGAVSYHRICGAIAVYLLAIFLWSDLYLLILEINPKALTLPPGSPALPPEALSGQFDDLHGTMIYFSVITITTLGYGDILPISPAARLAVMLQALFGQLYPSVLLAWLVSMEILTRTRKD
jgi:hypothetical protein